MRSTKLYAQAFFNAVDRDSSLSLYHDLDWVSKLPEQVIDYYSSLAFQELGQKDIFDQIKSDLGQVISDDVVRFMTIMIEDGFLKQVDVIADDYLDILNQEGIVKRVSVITASDLSCEFKAKLEEKLNNLYQLPLLVEYLIDPTYLGGVRVELDDSVIDTSYRTRLNRIVSEGLYES